MDYSEEYVVRISSGRRKIRRYIEDLGECGFRYEDRAGGKGFLEQKVYGKDVPDWEKYCKWAGLKCTVIPAKYTRSGDYRKQYFVNNPPVRNGKYRCAYCGRLFSKDKITIDHIIPVKKMSDSKKVRRYARTFGVDETNGLKNLCSACKRCNQKKGAQMGSWVVRGFLGKSEGLWKVRKAARIIVVWIIIILAIYINQTGTHFEVLNINRLLSPWG